MTDHELSQAEEERLAAIRAFESFRKELFATSTWHDGEPLQFSDLPTEEQLDELSRRETRMHEAYEGWRAAIRAWRIERGMEI